MRPKQSHPAGKRWAGKLTEVAVDDLAARQYAGNDLTSGYVRAMNYMELAARRRSLLIRHLFGGAPVRCPGKRRRNIPSHADMLGSVC